MSEQTELKLENFLVIVTCSDGSVREALISDKTRTKIERVLAADGTMKVANTDLSDVLVIDKNKLKPLAK